MATRKTFSFTRMARETFLAELAVTANVQAAARAADVPGTTFYHHRLIDPEFAHQWRMALLAGYDRLELALIRRALGMKDEQEDAEIGELDVDLALNQGGEMVRSVLKGASRHLPVTVVHARHGKVVRAEPVAALYERGEAWHAGVFPALEDELCGLVRGGAYEGPGRSPDRADACVWAMTELMLGGGGEVAVRGL